MALRLPSGDPNDRDADPIIESNELKDAGRFRHRGGLAQTDRMNIGVRHPRQSTVPEMGGAALAGLVRERLDRCHNRNY